MSTAYEPQTSASPIGRTTTVDTTTSISGGGAHIHRRIAWSAILGGVTVVVAVQILLSLLGAGIGLSTVDVGAGATPSATGLSVGAGIWWVLSSCIALFAGGYIAAWLAGVEISFDGMLHGLITWGLSLLMMVYVLSSAVSGLASGGYSAISSVGSAASGGVAQIAQTVGLSPDMLQQQAQAYMQPANPDPAKMTAQDAQKAIATDLTTYVQGGSDAREARERIISIMAVQGQTSREIAAKRFDDSQMKLQQTKDQAVQAAKTAADATASAASKTAFAGFAVSLLGLIAATLGGSLAVQRRVISSRRSVGNRAIVD